MPPHRPRAAWPTPRRPNGVRTETAGPGGQELVNCSPFRDGSNVARCSIPPVIRSGEPERTTVIARVLWKEPRRWRYCCGSGARRAWPGGCGQRAAALAGLASGHHVDAGDFVGGQGEAEEVEVGGHPVRPGRLRDHGDVVLQVP